VWVLERTDAPRVMVSVLFTLNTALVVVLQIPASRFADGLRRASRLLAWSGAVLAVAGLCFAAAGGTGDWVAVCWLGAAVLALSLGEVLATSACWDLSITLAPPAVRGRYLAVFNLGLSAERVLGPVVVTGLLLGAGTAGWLGAAAVFLLSGIAGQRVAAGAGTKAAAPVEAPVET